MKERALTTSCDQLKMLDLRAKFLQRAKHYFGVPYKKKYHQPGTEEYDSPLFLDCCGLVRRILLDLKEDLGFTVGRWNQAYQYDTLPIRLEREEDMEPGDLVFISAIYNDPDRKPQKHNMVHVEIWAGDGEKTIGARWQKGQVQVHDSYRFEAKSYHSMVYHFRSIDTWLQGICKSHCKTHPWRRKASFTPSRRSIFSREQAPQQDTDGSDSVSDAAMVEPQTTAGTIVERSRKHQADISLNSCNTLENDLPRESLVDAEEARRKSGGEDVSGPPESSELLEEAPNRWKSCDGRDLVYDEESHQSMLKKHSQPEGKGPEFTDGRLSSGHLLDDPVLTCPQQPSMLYPGGARNDPCGVPDLPEVIETQNSGTTCQRIHHSLDDCCKLQMDSSEPTSMKLGQMRNDPFGSPETEDTMSHNDSTTQECDDHVLVDHSNFHADYCCSRRCAFDYSSKLRLPCSQVDSMTCSNSVGVNRETLDTFNAFTHPSSFSAHSVPLASDPHDTCSSVSTVGSGANEGCTFPDDDDDYDILVDLDDAGDWLEDEESWLYDISSSELNYSLTGTCHPNEQLRNGSTDTSSRLDHRWEDSRFGEQLPTGNLDVPFHDGRSSQDSGPGCTDALGVSSASVGASVSGLASNSQGRMPIRDGTSDTSWEYPSPLPIGYQQVNNNRIKMRSGGGTEGTDLKNERLAALLFLISIESKLLSCLNDDDEDDGSCYCFAGFDGLGESSHAGECTQEPFSPCFDDASVIMNSAEQSLSKDSENEQTNERSVPHQRSSPHDGTSEEVLRGKLARSGIPLSKGALPVGDTCASSDGSAEMSIATSDTPEGETGSSSWIPEETKHGKLELSLLKAAILVDETCICLSGLAAGNIASTRDPMEDICSSDGNDDDDDVGHDDNIPVDADVPKDSSDNGGDNWSTNQIAPVLESGDTQSTNEQSVYSVDNNGAEEEKDDCDDDNIPRDADAPEDSSDNGGDGMSTNRVAPSNPGGTQSTNEQSASKAFDDSGQGGEREKPSANPDGRTSVFSRGSPPLFFIGGHNGVSLVEEPLLERGWRRLEDGRSDQFKLRWVEVRSQINYTTFRPGEQLINRIPGSGLLATKTGLFNTLREYERTMDRFKGNTSKAAAEKRLKMADFFPESFVLDLRADREKFFQTFKDGEIWICKPNNMNQGKGIYLVRDLVELRKKYEAPPTGARSKVKRGTNQRLIQRYLPNPLLLNGKKFDVRVYMLIACTSPFVVLYHTGYCRLSCEDYDSDSQDLARHLTNQYQQKRVPQYQDMKNETVWSMERFNEYVNTELAEQHGLANDWVFGHFTKRMQQIMTHCFHAVRSRLDTSLGLFDLLGFDFIIDADLKIWLLEVNVNPALHTNCDVLKEKLPSMIAETLDITLEVFEKNRRGQKILPITSLKQFNLLYSAPTIGSRVRKPQPRSMSKSPTRNLSKSPSQGVGTENPQFPRNLSVTKSATIKGTGKVKSTPIAEVRSPKKLSISKSAARETRKVKSMPIAEGNLPVQRLEHSKSDKI